MVESHRIDTRDMSELTKSVYHTVNFPFSGIKCVGR